MKFTYEKINNITPALTKLSKLDLRAVEAVKLARLLGKVETELKPLEETQRNLWIKYSMTIGNTNSSELLKKIYNYVLESKNMDKEFTKYIETSKVHANIVRTICGLGTSLNLDIICEGVETQAQADLVKKYGARLIQGYLIGRAVPFEKAVALLDKYNGKRK